jgi:hypothetical protein
MKTLREVQEEINNLLEEYPEWADLPVVQTDRDGDFKDMYDNIFDPIRVTRNKYGDYLEDCYDIDSFNDGNIASNEVTAIRIY